MGAFYVDQKKKDLPPSTLPSEHKQWVIMRTDEQAVIKVVPPIIFNKCLIGIVCDTGPARINYGFDANTLQCYAPLGVKDIVFNLIMLGY